MHEPSPLLLFATGFIPNHSIGVPDGCESLYAWATPVFLSLSVFFIGLWLARVRHMQTGPARALLWATAGCLAVSYLAWGVVAYRGHSVFSPSWFHDFPLLVVFAVWWWLVVRRLARPGPLCPRLETLAGCLAAGCFGWWLSTLFDLNWHASRGLGVWSVAAMPWLWAGACAAVIWRGWHRALPPARWRIQSAGAGGATAGFFVYCCPGGLLVGVVYRFLEAAFGTLWLDLMLHKLFGLFAFGVFVIGGALLGARVAWKRIRTEEAGREAAHPSPVDVPTSTSSG